MAKKIEDNEGRMPDGKFAEGNKISVGNNGGAPLKYSTPEELESFCKGYFEWADKNPWIKNDVVKGGEFAGTPLQIPTQRPYTLIALCHYLSLSLNGWKKYEERAEFVTVTTWVREKINNQQIEGAMVGAFNANLTARIQGISDKQDLTSNGETLTFGAFLMKSGRSESE
ncbi:terminase small subunit [Chryseobacterium sp. MHB01]|uniref:terminase small subunit n=1 Tax=Chryseobacterium sp. MHB01 TaxID=3109433 RepID=UPI002AFF0EEA|nr:terminase small subunit [Chryseobacterium sp. MHB01]MEA1849174.1 terminase small subunit [Chryseobacterium sp. MHB01]